MWFQSHSPGCTPIIAEVSDFQHVAEVIGSRSNIHGVVIRNPSLALHESAAPVESIDGRSCAVRIDEPWRRELFPTQIGHAIREAALALASVAGTTKFEVRGYRRLGASLSKHPHVDAPDFTRTAPCPWQCLIPLGRGTIVFPESSVNREKIEPYMLALLYSNMPPEERVHFRSEARTDAPYDFSELLGIWEREWKYRSPIADRNAGIELPPFTPLFVKGGLASGLVHASPRPSNTEEDILRQVINVKPSL